MREQTNLQQESSMLHWFPKVKDIIPVPRTEFFALTTEEAYQIIGLLDRVLLPETLATRIEAAAGKIGYPLFMRSDQGSAKHDYNHTCRVLSEDRLIPNLATLIEWHLMVDLWPRALAFREMLPLASPFDAFDGLPIAKERRYFVEDGKVICHHPYWPEGAIEFRERGRDISPRGWRLALKVLNVEEPEEVALLSTLAERFSRAVPGFFSVDFAMEKGGRWVMIDAARGELSWHPEHHDDE